MWIKQFTKSASLLPIMVSMLNMTNGQVLEEENSFEKEDKKPIVVNPSGGYKTKEEIEKPPVENHPCNLTETSVKISFPALKDELFVNLIGYKEPNLVSLKQCRGVCEERVGPIRCSPTAMKHKVVKMMFKSNSSGRDSVKRLKELVLDEHVSCGCECHQFAATQCVGSFNQAGSISKSQKFKISAQCRNIFQKYFENIKKMINK